jgi:hypothetical protein
MGRKQRRYADDSSNDKPNLEVVRGEGQKKRSEFAYCKWAAGAWEAEFYANTPTHYKSVDKTLKIMLNDPCWYSTLKRFNVDTKAAMRKIQGPKKPRRAPKDESGESA